MWNIWKSRSRTAHRPGAVFRDAQDCPEVVVIPPGKYLMGSPEDDPGRYTSESPMHEVTIGYSFAVARSPVTRGEWRRYLAQSGRTGSTGAWDWNAAAYRWERKPEYSFSNPGYSQEDSHPVVCVTWTEANRYAVWMSGKTGHRYRLLSESEFEYIQRAGSQTSYFWGDKAEDMHPYTRKRSADGELTGTWPVGTFKANAFGLHDTVGHVGCWTQDAWRVSYNGAPADGSAWGMENADVYAVRGGSWQNGPAGLRCAGRFNGNDVACTVVGLRLARQM